MITARRTGRLLQVQDLRVAFPTAGGLVHAVQGVSFALDEGEIVAIVGESGSGKSATALSLLALSREEGAQLAGSVAFAGEEVLSASPSRLRELRGAEISIVFQDPLSSLNPVQRIGDQIAEQLRAHRDLSRRQALEAASRALERAGLPDATSRLGAYPHQLSGGQRQRVMIAMALCCEPRLLVADEPTSALDVTTQAQILTELARLRRERGTAIVLVTHDLAIVADIADRVLVMHAGRIVEAGSVRQIFMGAQHPYTKQLLGALTSIDGGRRHRARAGADDAARGGPLLRLEDVSFEHAGRRDRRRLPTRPMKALDRVSLEVERGETLGIVGESGCGKTTLIRCAAGLLQPGAGRILFEGVDLAASRSGAKRSARRRMQVVFQDPLASLNPRRTVDATLGRPLRLRGVPRAQIPEQVARLLLEVGLTPEHRGRLPHQLSGGQRQRVGIARALALQPKLLLLDEPVSALDASVRAQIVQLLRELRSRHDLSCLFVAHDLALVAQVSDRIAVMHEGRIVEQGPTERILSSPSHPHTRALLSAVPSVERASARGELAPSRVHG